MSRSPVYCAGIFQMHLRLKKKIYITLIFQGHHNQGDGITNNKSWSYTLLNYINDLIQSFHLSHVNISVLTGKCWGQRISMKLL